MPREFDQVVLRDRLLFWLVTSLFLSAVPNDSFNSEVESRVSDTSCWWAQTLLEEAAQWVPLPGSVRELVLFL